MSHYGKHVVVAGADIDGQVRAEARRILLRNANESIEQIKGRLLSVKFLEKQCDLIGLFWEDDLAGCSSGPDPHWHMGWKAEILGDSDQLGGSDEPAGK